MPTHYHQAAYTLDPTKEVEDDEQIVPAVGHNDEDAEFVKERREAARENFEETSKADEEKAREWDERDPKPTPSELLHERAHEPKPEQEQGEPAPGSEDRAAESQEQPAQPEPKARKR